MQFKIEIVKEKIYSIIRLSGRLEYSVCEPMRRRIIDYIYKGNIYLIISLIDLDYINSLSIGLIKTLEEECTSMGGMIILASHEDKFKDFKDPFFKVFKVEKESIEYLENIMFR